jgi:hypothetical protein
MFKNILTVTRKNIMSTAMETTSVRIEDKWLDVKVNTSFK